MQIMIPFLLIISGVLFIMFGRLYLTHFCGNLCLVLEVQCMYIIVCMSIINVSCSYLKIYIRITLC